jgi:hypothetical protein
MTGIAKALGWSGSDQLGVDFARGALPDLELCARLLTPHKLLDLVMRRSLTMDGLRCLVDGVDLHPRNYLGRSPARRGLAVPMADMNRIGSLLHSGCTLVLDMAQLYDPTLEVACRALQWWCHELVQVNVYLTTGQAAGFQLHWDDHAVIVVQLAGEKSWEVRGRSRVAPMYRDAAPNSQPPNEIVWMGSLQPGEVMHIPRGFWHQATREDKGDGFSLHATFGITKQTGVHWLSWLADQARANERFRQDLGGWCLADEHHAEELALIDDAVRLVATQPPSDYLTARAQTRPAARHVATHGVFGPPSSVVCNTEFPPMVEACGEQVALHAGGKVVTCAKAALPALELLLSGVPVNVADVSAATGVDAAELATVLTNEDLCAEVTPALAVGYADWVS